MCVWIANPLPTVQREGGTIELGEEEVDVEALRCRGLRGRRGGRGLRGAPVGGGGNKGVPTIQPSAPLTHLPLHRYR